MEQLSAAAPAPQPDAAAAAQLRRALLALAQLTHLPTPTGLARLCSLLDAHCRALQERSGLL